MKIVKHLFMNIEEYLVAVFMAAISIIVFWQVINRQLGASLPWSEEMTRYLLVWITFVGASLGVKRGAHIGIEAVLLLLPLRMRKAVMLGSLVPALLFCAVVLYYSLVIINMQMSTGQVSPAMRIPMWWPYAALPVGMSLMIIRFIQVAIRSIKTFGDDNVVVKGLEGK